MKRVHFSRFTIAGFSFYEGALIFNQLSTGTQLTLVRETHNQYDPNAIAIYFDDTKIGFIPQDGNYKLSKLFDAGYSHLFECYIQRLVPENHPEKQVEAIVFLLANIEAVNTAKQELT